MKTLLTDLNITHFDPYFEMVNSKVVHAAASPAEPFSAFTEAQIKEWLIGLSEKNNRKDFAILDKASKVFIGEVVLNEIKNNEANIRVALLPKFFNQGYGTEAIKMAADYGFSQMNLKKITLSVYGNNPGGLRVYEKCGFKKDTRNKINEGLYIIGMSLVSK